MPENPRPTSTASLTQFDKAELLPLHEMPTPTNLPQALNQDAPTVREWVAADQGKAINEIAAELVLFADVINVSQNINPEKARRMAELFLAMPEVHNLTMAELKVFLRDAFNFRFGQLYGGFGWNDLAVWLRHFLEELAVAKRTRVRPLEPEEPHIETTPQEQLQQLHTMLDNIGEVPIVYPFYKVFEIIKTKDPDAFRHWYLAEAHTVEARAKAFGIKEGMLAKTIGESMRAETYKSEASIEHEVRTAYVKHYCKNYLNQKQTKP